MYELYSGSITNKRLVISDSDTIYHIQLCFQLHPRTLEFFHIVFPWMLEGFGQNNQREAKVTWFCRPRGTIPESYEWIRFPDWIQREGSGVQHTFGLVDLTLKFSDMNIPTVWVHPETHLHPAVQGNLADLAIKLIEKYKTPEEKRTDYIAKVKKDIGYPNPNEKPDEKPEIHPPKIP